jgi:hypothetical protein
MKQCAQGEVSAESTSTLESIASCNSQEDWPSDGTAVESSKQNLLNQVGAAVQTQAFLV